MRLLLILALTAAFGMLLSALLMPVGAPAGPIKILPCPPYSTQDNLVPWQRERMIPCYPDNAPIRDCQHTCRAYQLIYPGPNSSTCLQCGKRFAPGE